MRTARDIMKTDIPTLNEGDSLLQALESLRESGTAALPIVSSNKQVIGAFSRLHAIDAYMAEAPLSDPAIKHCSLSPALIHEDLPFALISRKLTSSKSSNAFVTDSAGRFVGVVDSSSAVDTLVHEIQQRKSFIEAFVNNSTCATLTLSSNFEVINTNSICDSILHTAKISAQELCDLIKLKFDKDRLRRDQDAASFHTITMQIGSIPIYGNIFFLDQYEVEVNYYFSFSTMAHLIDNYEEIEKLKQYIRNYRTILNVINETIFVTDLQGKVVYCNKSAEQFFEIPTECLLNQPVVKTEINREISLVLKTAVPVVEQTGYDPLSDKHYLMSVLPVIKRNRIQGALCVITYHESEDLSALSQKLVQEQVMLDGKDAGNEDGGMEFGDFISSSDKMLTALKDAELIASSQSTVLISGESGVGKGSLAKAIHNASSRKGRPFVVMHCGAIANNMFETECFGYVSNSFLDDQTIKTGLFELANKGTLLLDDVDDMPLDQQARLLHFLETKTVTPVGASRGTSVDVRIIATATQDLQKMVRDGSFRSDLYYRLNVISLQLPPLRDRVEDIYPLISYFLPLINREYKKNVTSVSDSFLAACKQYAWPGNVWELKNTIDRAVRFSQGSELQLEDLPPSVLDMKSDDSARYQDKPISAFPAPEPPARHELTREVVTRALLEANGNKSKAAKMLGISRTWMYKCMQKYGL